MHITVSTLFIGIVVLLGFLSSLQGYNKSSDIVFSSAAQFYEKISQETQLQFKATCRSVVGSLWLLALSPSIQADIKAARIESLPLLATALSEVAAVSAIKVGYANGDYFIIWPLRTGQMRERFVAPAQADVHIDPDLFRPFLQSGVWKARAERFLDPAKIDKVDIDRYLA